MWFILIDPSLNRERESSDHVWWAGKRMWAAFQGRDQAAAAKQLARQQQLALAVVVVQV